MTHAILIAPFSAGVHAPSDCGLKSTAKAGSAFSLHLLCHTRYGSFCGNSHRPCGLTLPKGRDPSGLPAADKARLPSVGAAAPIGTTYRRSCPYKIGGAKFCTFAQSISTALAATCTSYYRKGVSGLTFSARQTAPLSHRITLDSCKELDAVKPVERLTRLTTKCKRCQHIVHSLFTPQGIPLGKNVIY